MTRRALVTGCSRGIGRAVAEMLLAEGWEVRGVARTIDVDWAFEHADNFWPMWADISVPTFPEALAVVERGPIDALVHCAAIRPAGRFDAMSPREWRRVIDVDLIGTYNVVQACLPALLRSDDGRILLFSGGGAFGPKPGYSAYAAAKAGVVALADTLAEELRDTSVTVNCVAPGYVPTTMHDAPVPDGGEAMACAVACVQHLLSARTRGLTGKTISAAFDDWPSIDQTTVGALNTSAQGTRSRHLIAQVAALRRVG